MFMIEDGGIYYDEEIAEFFQNCTKESIVFTPVYQYYSYHRVRQLLREEYNLDMITNHGGYKANRYRDFCTYKLVWLDSGEVYADKVTLHQLRRCLAKDRMPLHQSKRRKGCERFLQIVNALDNPADESEVK